MPQMAPMSWTTLMIYFIIMMIMMATLNYYMSQPINSSSHQTNLKTSSINWKW